MDIYIFPSTSLENLRKGIERGMWAVAPIEEPYATARRSRALQMPTPAAGLFYCSDPQLFTVPFRIESRPKDETVPDVWSEVWYLPFQITSIGDMRHTITLPHARNTWPILEGGVNPTHVLNLSGAMAFAATWIQRRNWDIILEQLEIEAEEFEDYFT